MQKYFKKNNLKILKVINDNNLGSIPKNFFQLFVVIFFFYYSPIIINFTEEKILITKDHQNNSKAILAYTLNQKSKGAINNNDTLNERDLLD